MSDKKIECWIRNIRAIWCQQHRNLKPKMQWQSTLCMYWVNDKKKALEWTNSYGNTYDNIILRNAFFANRNTKIFEMNQDFLLQLSISSLYYNMYKKRKRLYYTHRSLRALALWAVFSVSRHFSSWKSKKKNSPISITVIPRDDYLSYKKPQIQKYKLILPHTPQFYFQTNHSRWTHFSKNVNFIHILKGNLSYLYVDIVWY
jgi:hypothetical protein